MSDRCQSAQNSISLQADMFRLAERDHGLSIRVLARKTCISAETLKSWRNGTTMPAWALFCLGRSGGIPDDLLSLIGEPFGCHVGSDEDGEGDLDTAADHAAEFVDAVRKARNPASPGGCQIVPQETVGIEQVARRAVASIRRAL